MKSRLASCAPLTILGGSGYDYLVQKGLGNVYFDAEEGESSIEIGEGVTGEVTLRGGTGPDDIKYNSTATLWADLRGGDDVIEITADHDTPITIYAGPGNDTITYRGSGPALFNGGTGDDVIQGSSTSTVFQYEDDFGYDTLTKQAGTTELDFSRVNEPIDAPGQHAECQYHRHPRFPESSGTGNHQRRPCETAATGNLRDYRAVPRP
ncbi:MAG UNVERIFIED_CONTAM: hypothetical protein LVR18_24720 [Planctomycetaceae bacterium]